MSTGFQLSSVDNASTLTLPPILSADFAMQRDLAAAMPPNRPNNPTNLPNTGRASAKPAAVFSIAGSGDPAARRQNYDTSQNAVDVVTNSTFGKDPVNRDILLTVQHTPIRGVENLEVFGQARKEPDIQDPTGKKDPSGKPRVIEGNFYVQINADLLRNPELAAVVLLHESVHVQQGQKNPNAKGYLAANIQREVDAFAVEMKLWSELRSKFVDKNGKFKQKLTPYLEGVVKSEEAIYKAYKNGGKAGIKNEIKNYPVYRDLPDLDVERRQKPGPHRTESWGIPFPF